MRQIRLTTVEPEQLAYTFKTTSDRRLRERGQAVLMASRGRKRQALAQALGGHRTTVRRWLQQYHHHGLAGLTIQWAPGQARGIPATFAPTIQDWVKGGPQGCGLDRANWTYEELAVYLYQTTGIEVQRTAMRDFGHRHGIGPNRPPYPYLGGAPRKRREGGEELQGLKKSPSRGVRAAEP